jgi:2-C-methyl-D-erythritol 4-phosphate cytidylyltransferase
MATNASSTFSVILAAGGQSSRFQDPNYKKQFALLDGKAVWLHSVERFLKRNDVRQVIIVVPGDEQDAFLSRFGANVAVLGIELVSGGKLRAESIRNGLAVVRGDIDFVAIHDAARPCLTDALIDRVFRAAQQHGAAIPAIPVAHTVKQSKDGRTVERTLDRIGLWLAQTPQAFGRQALQDAFASAVDFSFTDEAQLMEQAGHIVHLVEGSPLNVKITGRSDLGLASAILKSTAQKQFDAPPHPFADDRLWR